VDAAKYLHHATLAAATGNRQTAMTIQSGLTIDPSSGSNFSAADGAAYSTFFLASSLLQNSALYTAERALEAVNKGLLISAVAQPSNKWVHLIDGGFIDSSGIVAQLQNAVRRIFAVYACNDCLLPADEKAQCQTASFAYLFGHEVKTDDINSLAGPKLTQVFDSSLYDEVMANLTNPDILLARLRNVKVAKNEYLGINPYTIDEIMILSNAGSAQFVEGFTDPVIKQHIAADWPDRMAISMDEFNANMLCEYERYKLAVHEAEIKAFFQDVHVSYV